jgi:hypothetical protein
MKASHRVGTLDSVTVRRILAVVAVLLSLPGCDRGAREPARQAGAEQKEIRSQSRAPMPAPARTEVVGTAWNGKVAVFGGLTADSQASVQADLYDPVTDSWSSLPALPAAVHHAGAGVLGGRLYIVGGYGGEPGWPPTASVASLGPGEAAWRPEPPLSAPRGALAVASLSEALVAIGGVAGPDLVRTEILDLGAGGWRRGPNLTSPREHLGATATGGRAYAVAGRIGTLESNQDTVESLGPRDDRWRIEPKLNHTRGGTGASRVAPVPGGEMACVAGGEEPGGRTIAPVECLRNGAWAVVAQLAVPRHGLAVVGLGRHLHVIGGGPQAGLTVSDTHEVFEF